MYVVVGLGNPGKDYTNTRHNVGFNAVDQLAERNGIKINKIKFKSLYGEGFIGREKVILVKPQTYMNNSGQALAELVQFYKIPVENIIVIVDDIDIDFASIRIRLKGSAGSHNGLKSIIRHLNQDSFPRVRLGIGKKHPQQDLADFVLSRFSKEENPYIEEAIVAAAQAVETIVEDGINNAMNKYNVKKNKAQE